jgi:hypothetical protein
MGKPSARIMRNTLIEIGLALLKIHYIKNQIAEFSHRPTAYFHTPFDLLYTNVFSLHTPVNPINMGVQYF